MRICVSLDRDFEDGEFGSDGEFYASGVKQVSFAPKRTKDSSRLLQIGLFVGVFEDNFYTSVAGLFCSLIRPYIGVDLLLIGLFLGLF